MVTEIIVSRQRGGNRHPVSVRNFILEHLATTGEDYIASMHRAYKAELDNQAFIKGRKYAYRKPVYHSFEVAVQLLAREGLIEFSGREEESDSPQFVNWDIKPKRRYYRLSLGAPSMNGHQDGHKPALRHGIDTDGRQGQEKGFSTDGTGNGKS